MRFTVEQSLQDFQFWQGAKEFAKLLTPKEFEIIEDYLESDFSYAGEIPTETQINDLFWFEDEFITTEILGYSIPDAIYYRNTDRHYHNGEKWYTLDEIRKEYETLYDPDDEYSITDYIDDNFTDIDKENN